MSSLAVVSCSELTRSLQDKPLQLARSYECVPVIPHMKVTAALVQHGEPTPAVRRVEGVFVRLAVGTGGKYIKLGGAVL